MGTPCSSAGLYRFGIGLIAALLVTAIPASGFGQDDQEESIDSSDLGAEEGGGGSDLGKDTARRVLELLREGRKSYKDGDFQAAYDTFQKAYDMWPRPEIQVRIGKAAEKLGRPKETLEHYRGYLEEAPEGNMADDVRDEIERLEEEYAVTVEFTSSPSDAEVYRGSIDGEKLGTTSFKHEFKPGEITVAVSKPGYEPVTRTVDLELGELNRMDFELDEKRLSETQVETDTGTSEGKPTRRSRVPGIWAWGTGIAGVAGLGTGVVLSVLKGNTASKVQNYDRGAAGSSREELEGLQQQALGQHRASLVAFSAGGALTAVGGSMLLIRALKSSGGDEESANLSVGVAPRPDGAGATLQWNFR